MTNHLTYRDHLAIEQMLLGRRVVEAYMGDKRFYDGPVGVLGKYWPGSADGFLRLDNDVMVYVLANEGCGGCGAGNSRIQNLGSVDNIITRVQFDNSEDGSKDIYKIFVFAGNEKINLLQVDSEGNDGWDYGTGYDLVIEFPDE